MDDLFSLLYAIDNRTRSLWSRPACVHHTRSANLVGGGPWGPLKNQTRDALLNEPPYFLKLSLKSLPRGQLAGLTAASRATRLAAKSRPSKSVLRRPGSSVSLSARPPEGLSFSQAS